MAWVAYIDNVTRLGSVLAVVEASGPRAATARTSWMGMPLLASWQYLDNPWACGWTRLW